MGHGESEGAGCHGDRHDPGDRQEYCDRQPVEGQPDGARGQQIDQRRVDRRIINVGPQPVGDVRPPEEVGSAIVVPGAENDRQNGHQKRGGNENPSENSTR